MITEYSTLIDFGQALQRNALKLNNIYSASARVELFCNAQFYESKFKEEDRTRTKLLQRLSSFNYYFWFLKNVVDVHLFSILLPKNITLKFTIESEAYPGKWRVVNTDACGKHDIHTSGLLRMVFNKHTTLNQAYFQDTALIFQTNQLNLLVDIKRRNNGYTKFKSWFLRLIYQHGCF